MMLTNQADQTARIVKNHSGQKATLIDFEYATAPVETLFEKFKSSSKGLSDAEAYQRLKEYGYNEPAKKKKRTILAQILSKFINPLVIVLIIVGTASWYMAQDTSDLIGVALVFAMVLISVFLSFVQEYRSGKEAEKLSEMVRATATVLRNGRQKEVKIKEIVPGDIVDLYAGDMIPADLRIISCKDLFINQASLTGESFPVEKYGATLQSANYSLSALNNIAFMGSSVVSGTALGLVTKTGVSTQFGEISRKLATMSIQTNFDKGIIKFTWLMVRYMIIMVVVIFAINSLTKGDFKEAFLFSLSVAVGLTPEMLPLLVAVNLSKGAIAMSKKDVIVKRLNSIQNFGAMDVLCTDKTGTLTLDKVVLMKHCDVVGDEDEDVLRFAYINSFYQTGLKNLLDRAVMKYQKLQVKQYKKIDEIPFDFSRKIMSVVVEMDGCNRMIVKGAPEEIFKRCSHFYLDGEATSLEGIRSLILVDLEEEYYRLSADGFRVLAIAYKDLDKKESYSKDDEHDLILKGYIAFLDPPRPTARRAIKSLAKRGIEVKVLTGDNELVSKKICTDVGLDIKELVTGEQVDKLNEQELEEIVEKTTVFARLAPMQKERVISALRANGHIVGYLGDGINDAPSLKSADIGISVNNAVDIAKETADIILLKKSLMVLEDGVVEGRKTFGNIVKYIKMGASSNLGNMISMTGASIFLKFLPMLPIQILLNNFLYDMSQTAIPTDEVDKEYLEKPRTWNISSIRNFMLVLGSISSIFDFLTFGVLLYILHAPENLFQTSWFLESLLTQTLVIHIIRTDKIPFIQSRASKWLTATSIIIALLGIIIPYSPFGKAIRFGMPPFEYLGAIILIVLIYLVAAQTAKNWFIRKFGWL